jgi:hypothetical protein
MTRASYLEANPSEEQPEVAEPNQPVSSTTEEFTRGPAATSEPAPSAPEREESRPYPWHWGINE